MTTAWAMEVGQELPALPLEWLDKDGSVIDFSSGWTFTVKLSTQTAPTVAVLTKTSGITSAATSPNVTIDWTTSELASLTAGGTVYELRVIARRTADSKDRVFRPGDPIKLRLFDTAT